MIPIQVSVSINNGIEIISFHGSSPDWFTPGKKKGMRSKEEAGGEDSEGRFIPHA